MVLDCIDSWSLHPYLLWDRCFRKHSPSGQSTAAIICAAVWLWKSLKWSRIRMIYLTLCVLENSSTCSFANSEHSHEESLTDQKEKHRPSGNRGFETDEFESIPFMTINCRHHMRSCLVMKVVKMIQNKNDLFNPLCTGKLFNMFFCKQ